MSEFMLSTLRGSVVYLATPYSSWSDDQMELRWQRVTAFASVLETVGITTFSPVTQNRSVAQVGAMCEGWDTWKTSCLRLLDRCDALLLLPCYDNPIAAWTSVGVQTEIEHALSHDKSCWVWSPARKRISWTDHHQAAHEDWLKSRSLLSRSSDQDVKWSEGDPRSTPQPEQQAGSETSQPGYTLTPKGLSALKAQRESESSS